MTVPEMFESIAPQYDRTNRVLSLGLDLYWRRAVCRYLPKKQRIKLLDCATGTGDQLVTLLKNCPTLYDSVGIDPAANMLSRAAPKLARYSHRCRLALGAAEDIPFPDAMFDVVTVSFGLRNVADVSESLSEIYRVLSPNGRLIILEFSHPPHKLIRFFHRFYLQRIVPRLGQWLSPHLPCAEHAYLYLSKTIETFPQGIALLHILQKACFTHVQAKPLSGGIVSIYIGDKNGSSTSFS